MEKTLIGEIPAKWAIGMANGLRAGFARGANAQALAG